MIITYRGHVNGFLFRFSFDSIDTCLHIVHSIQHSHTSDNCLHTSDLECNLDEVVLPVCVLHKICIDGQDILEQGLEYARLRKCTPSRMILVFKRNDSFYTTKNESLTIKSTVTTMEDKAIEMLQLMLSRRGLKTDLQRLTMDVDAANIYQIGDALVVFSQKQRSLQERDIKTLVELRDNPGQLLILVTMAPPSENVLKTIKQLSGQKVQLFHIRELQFDIMSHRMVVPHRILKEDERQKVFELYKTSKPEEQLPWIDSQDAPIKWIGAVPGDIIEVTRHSPVAGREIVYRYCVEDANVA